MGRAGTPHTGMQAVQCRWWPGSLSVVDTRFHAVHALRALGSRCGSPRTTGSRHRPPCVRLFSSPHPTRPHHMRARRTFNLASENHDSEPKREECSQSSLMSHEKNVRKKLANANALLFRATAPDVIPTRAWGMTSVYAWTRRRRKPAPNTAQHFGVTRIRPLPISLYRKSLQFCFQPK